MTKTIEPIRKTLSRDEIIYEHLADTYFRQKTRHKPRRKKVEQLTYVRKISYISLALIILAEACVLGLASISFLNAKYIAYLKKKVAASNAVAIIDNGAANREIMKSFALRGLAKFSKEKSSKNGMALNNVKKYNWADLTVEFKFPIDFYRRYILLTMRGRHGGEKVSMVLRDVNNRSLRLNELCLSSKWHSQEIHLKDVKAAINLSKISGMRIEYGRVGELGGQINSPIDVTIYLKKIELPKEV
jgi:hypothetical protein